MSNQNLITAYSIDSYGNLCYQEYNQDDETKELLKVLYDSGDIFFKKDVALTKSNLIKNQIIKSKVSNFPRLSEFVANNPESKELLRVLQSHIRDEHFKKSGFIFLGNAGVGKTFAMQCIASALIERRYQIKFVNINSILDEIKNTFGNESSELDVIRKYSEIEYLFLDDFGAERQSEFTQNAIYKIIDNRYQSKLTTYVSSNYKLDELQTINDIAFERIVSRLQDMSITLNLNGETRRENRIIDIG